MSTETNPTVPETPAESSETPKPPVVATLVVYGLGSKPVVALPGRKGNKYHFTLRHGAGANGGAAHVREYTDLATFHIEENDLRSIRNGLWMVTKLGGTTPLEIAKAGIAAVLQDALGGPHKQAERIMELRALLALPGEANVVDLIESLILRIAELQDKEKFEALASDELKGAIARETRGPSDELLRAAGKLELINFSEAFWGPEDQPPQAPEEPAIPEHLDRDKVKFRALELRRMGEEEVRNLLKDEYKIEGVPVLENFDGMIVAVMNHEEGLGHFDKAQPAPPAAESTETPATPPAAPAATTPAPPAGPVESAPAPVTVAPPPGNTPAAPIGKPVVYTEAQLQKMPIVGLKELAASYEVPQTTRKAMVEGVLAKQPRT